MAVIKYKTWKLFLYSRAINSNVHWDARNDQRLMFTPICVITNYVSVKCWIKFRAFAKHFILKILIATCYCYTKIAAKKTRWIHTGGNNFTFINHDFVAFKKNTFQVNQIANFKAFFSANAFFSPKNIPAINKYLFGKLN